MRGFGCASEFFKGVLSAPISSTDTIRPSSPAPGSLKYFLKCGPVMMPSKKFGNQRWPVATRVDSIELGKLRATPSGKPFNR